MLFRPCIDLHNGLVKQIVGSTLDDDNDNPVTNFTAEKPSEWYAELYKKDNLTGGHIIKLGPGNDKTAKSALNAWPEGMQIGGGINIDNAQSYIDEGAASVIVTSWVFHDGKVEYERLKSLTDKIGKDRLVLDLSCRKKGDDYFIVTDRWQNFTSEIITPTLLDDLSSYCHEFLIHAVDVEGKSSGIEKDLVKLLGNWSGIPVTYAGGVHCDKDIDEIGEFGKGNLDFTVGSALDIFGGSGLTYNDLVGKYS